MDFVKRKLTNPLTEVFKDIFFGHKHEKSAKSIKKSMSENTKDHTSDNKNKAQSSAKVQTVFGGAQNLKRGLPVKYITGADDLEGLLVLSDNSLVFTPFDVQGLGLEFPQSCRPVDSAQGKLDVALSLQAIVNCKVMPIPHFEGKQKSRMIYFLQIDLCDHGDFVFRDDLNAVVWEIKEKKQAYACVFFQIPTESKDDVPKQIMDKKQAIEGSSNETETRIPYFEFIQRSFDEKQSVLLKDEMQKIKQRVKTRIIKYKKTTKLQHSQSHIVAESKPAKEEAKPVRNQIQTQILVQQQPQVNQYQSESYQQPEQQNFLPPQQYSQNYQSMNSAPYANYNQQQQQYIPQNQYAQPQQNYVPVVNQLSPILKINHQYFGMPLFVPQTQATHKKKKKLVMPNMLAKSEFLDDFQFAQIVSCAPDIYHGSDWNLLYSNFQHGTSYNTLMRKCKAANPFIVLIKDMGGNVFGAYGSDSLKMLQDYYGTGETFLFTFKDNQQEISEYAWSKKNRLFMYVAEDGIMFGDGPWYGLWICSDLARGRTFACETFDSQPLSSEKEFGISRIEVWGVANSF